MPVSVQTPYNQYTGNGVATVYAYEFQLLSADDLTVTIDGVVTTAYTLSGLGVDSGGNVTFSTAPANGTIVLIRRSVLLSRETDYQTAGDFEADVVDPDFDRLWMALQDQGTAIEETTLRGAIGEVILEMPNAADRAGYWLYFDDDGNPQVGTPTATEMTVSAFMETVLDDGSAAAARLTLGIRGEAGTTGGTSSAFTLTPSAAPAAYAEDQEFDVEFHTASTGTPTLNVSGLGAKSLKYRGPTGTLVTCGTLIPSGWRSKVTYDGTDLIVREMPQSAYNSASTPAAGTAAGTAGSAGTHSDSAHAHPPMSGSVIQEAYVNTATGQTAYTNVIPEDGTIPQNTEGDQIASLAFTPKLASSTLKVEFTASAITGGSYRVVGALFVDSTANALDTHVATNAPVVIRYYVAAGSTSARTYKVRFGPAAAGTAYLNGNFGTAAFGTLSVTEIAA